MPDCFVEKNDLWYNNGVNRLIYFKIKNQKMEIMKKIARKLAEHGRRHVHFSIFIPIVVVAMLGLVDWPLFSLAEEMNLDIPIVHVYKIAENEGGQGVTTVNALAPVAETSAPTTATEVVNQPIQTVESIKTIETVKQIEPMQAVENFKPIEQQNVTTTKSVQNQDNNSGNQGEQKQINQPAEEMEMEFVDPREVKNALQDIKRMIGDLKRFAKQLKKLPNNADDLAAVNELLNQLSEHQKSIQNPPADESLRSMLQEFWEGRYWEEVDKIRAKVELPKELAGIKKDLARLKKLITTKPFKNLGFDMAALAQNISEIQIAYDEANTNYSQGNMEDAWVAMEVIHSGMHPGEVMGVLYQTKEIKDRIKSVKNKEVKELVNEILLQVIESADAGDFRGANQALNEIRQELLKIMEKYVKQPGVLDEKMRAKFDKLESVIENKLNKDDGDQKNEQAEKK